MQEVDALYEWIDGFCRENLRALYIERYTELWRWLKHQEPDDQIDELVEMYLAGLWDKPNEITHYAFEPELVRKRDRAKEAIFAVPTRVQKQLELEKAGRYVIQQVGFYVDITSQDAELQAFKDAGVERVKWVVYGDDKVCDQCEELDGRIFDIDKVPPKVHPRCRCHLIPVGMKG